MRICLGPSWGLLLQFNFVDSVISQIILMEFKIHSCILCQMASGREFKFLDKLDLNHFTIAITIMSQKVGILIQDKILHRSQSFRVEISPCFHKRRNR